MPEFSRFYGLTIRMYYDEHPPPHFDVSYQGVRAVVGIETLELLRGNLPRRAMVLAVEWALAHRNELRQNWSRIESGEQLVAIAPLD